MFYHFLVDFTELVSLQGVDDMPVSGLFVTRKISVTVGFNIRKVDICADDKCDDFFSVFIAWNAEDACFQNVLVLQESCFDVQSADLETSFFDDVLGQTPHNSIAVGAIE